jgi:putative glutamine amidotransferase
MADRATESPRIGLITYGRNDENWYSLPAQYVDSIRRAGGIPVLLPPGEPRLDEWLQAIDAMILPGGGDLSPGLYGGHEHNKIYMIDADRDRDELAVARHVVDSGLPTLAICRGMQVLNVAFGGNLIEHLPETIGKSMPHRGANRGPVPHTVAIAPGSRLADVMGTTAAEPISMHHQAVRRVAEGFDVVAHAPDGTIEAMEMPGHPWLLAVQWHPELSAADDPTQQRLFDALVLQAKAQASGHTRGES